jgi:hypothetical protein
MYYYRVGRLKPDKKEAVEVMTRAAKGGSDVAWQILEGWSKGKEKKKTIVAPLKKGKGSLPKTS